MFTRSDSSESSSSDGSEEETNSKGSRRRSKSRNKEAASTLPQEEKALVEKKAFILKNMELLIEQKERLDAQKDKLSRTHRGEKYVLDGILSVNTALNEEITKRIQNMSSAVDKINKSIREDAGEDVPSKSKSKKSKKKKSRKKHKKEKRSKDSHASDDEHHKSKSDKAVDVTSPDHVEKSDEDMLQEVGTLTDLTSQSPVVAPRYWEIVKPLTSTDFIQGKPARSQSRERSMEHPLDPEASRWDDDFTPRKHYEDRGWDDNRRPDHDRRMGFHPRDQQERFPHERHRDPTQAPYFAHERDGNRQFSPAGQGRPGHLYEKQDMHAPDRVRPSHGGRYLDRNSASPSRDVRRQSYSREDKKFQGMYADNKYDDDNPQSRSSSYSKEGNQSRETPDKLTNKPAAGRPSVAKENAHNIVKGVDKDSVKQSKNRSTPDVKEQVSVAPKEKAQPKKETDDAPGFPQYIDQGMHWCSLCNVFCETLPQYVSHVLQKQHLNLLQVSPCNINDSYCCASLLFKH